MTKQEGKAIKLIDGKEGKLYFRLIVVAAIIAAAVYSAATLAAIPLAEPHNGCFGRHLKLDSNSAGGVL